MKTITIYGRATSSGYRLDHTTLERDTGGVDDDSWNTVVAVLRHYAANNNNVFAYDFGFDL